jgi:hypothetical protein
VAARIAERRDDRPKAAAAANSDVDKSAAD